MIAEDFRLIRVLGTGNGLFTPRYWSGMLVDDDILLDAPPTVGIHLRKMGVDARQLRHVFISHLHADHMFGLVFLYLEFYFEHPRTTPLTIVGPKGIQEYVEALYRLAYPFAGPQPANGHPLKLEFHEVDGPADGNFGALAWRAVPMVHHAKFIQSYGYRLTRGGRTIAYSGDTAVLEPVVGLAQGADVLVVECTNPDDGNYGDHLCVRDMAELRDRLPPSTKIWITHITQAEGAAPPAYPAGTSLLEDFDTKAL